MKKVELFISYASEDNEEQKRLAELLRTKSTARVLVDVLTDDLNRAGEWNSQILGYINKAQIGVVLLSNAFLRSTFCDTEVRSLLNRRPPIRIIPIILENCVWEHRFPELDRFQFALQKKIIGKLPDSMKESAWIEAADFIKAEIYDVAFPEIKFDSNRPPAGGILPAAAIQDAVENGFFTPVIGPACNLLREKRTGAIPHLQERYRYLLGKLNDSNDYKHEKSYACAIIKSNFEDCGLDELAPLEESNSSWLSALVTFQAAIVRVGVAGIRLFSQALAADPHGFTDVSAFAVVIDQEGCDREPLREALLGATKCAETLGNLSDAPAEKHSSLGIKGVRQQLIWLTWVIFFLDLVSGDKKAKAWAETHPLGDPPFSIRPERPKLSLLQLEWLGDLFWHILRFDAPMYPSMDDLSFQLSVCVSDVPPPRKGPVGSMALLAREKERTEIIAAWFNKYSAEIEPTSSGFYSALTDVLYRQMVELEEESSGGTAPLGSADRALSDADKIVPLAISTSFDLDLEKSLRRTQKDYTVVVPVWVNFLRRGSRKLILQADWLMVNESAGKPPCYFLLGDQSDVQSMKDKITGPLVIKLHGSPLQKLPQRIEDVQVDACKYLSDGSKGKEILHRLILSDYDFLREIMMESGADSLPPGLRDFLIEDGRALCFLGYPVTDSISRLRLYDHIRGDNRPSQVLLVDSPRDRLHHAFLQKLDVALVEITLDEFAETINRSR